MMTLTRFPFSATIAFRFGSSEGDSCCEMILGRSIGYFVMLFNGFVTMQTTICFTLSHDFAQHDM
jgi:hypothetical protein